MRNQICLITGATSGLGKYISYELSKKNYQLILIGKSKKKINSLKKKFKNKKYSYICADFTNFNELKKVIRILKKFSKIDLLINNCGGLIKENEKLHNSKTIMLNYFSHVFITEKIKRKLLNSKIKKIIFISSYVHKNISKEALNISKNKNFNFWNLYKISKFFLTTYSYIFFKKNTKYNIFAINPGRISTNFRFHNSSILTLIMNIYLKIFGKNAEDVSKRIVKLFLNKNINTNNIYYDVDNKALPNENCLNKKFQNKLWDFSKKYLKLEI